MIGAALSGSFNTVLSRSIKQFDRLGSAIKQTQASTRNITAFQKLRRDLSQAEAAFQQARDRLATLRREMQNTARPTRQMRARLAEAHKEVHRLGQRLDQQRQALMQQRRAMQAAGQSTVGLTAQKKRLGDTVGRCAANMTGWARPSNAATPCCKNAPRCARNWSIRSRSGPRLPRPCGRPCSPLHGCRG